MIRPVKKTNLSPKMIWRIKSDAVQDKSGLDMRKNMLEPKKIVL